MKARDKGIVAGAGLLAALLLLPAVGQGAFVGPGGTATVQATGQERPAEATAENIEMGKGLFETAKCAGCHGADAKGKGSMTQDMTNGEWKFADGGSFAALVKVIKDGLTKEQTGGRIAMPAAAARDLTDEQVTALAAYVWSLNHPAS